MTPTVLGIDKSMADEGVTVKQLWSQTDPPVFEAGYSVMVSLLVAGKLHLLAYVASTGKASVFLIGDDEKPFTPVDSMLPFGIGWDAINSFVLGNKAYVMCYKNMNGLFAFFAINDDLSCSRPFLFSHPRDPGISVGFTTVKSVVCLGAVYFLGYNFDTGNIVLYSLAVTSKSDDDVPPLAAHHLWQRSWAPGWTRFSFFYLGSECFFLKTNVKRPNVNIDHVQDNPKDGTVEVSTRMHLDNDQLLDSCTAISLVYGDPYFIAYMKNGKTVIYRIHSDCRGFTTARSVDLPAGATQIVSLGTGYRARVLLY